MDSVNKVLLLVSKTRASNELFCRLKGHTERLQDFSSVFCQISEY